MTNVSENKRKTIPYLDTFIFVAIMSLYFGYLGSQMGTKNMFSTLMNTAHDLLLNVVFYIMAVAVLAGAFGKLASEFHLVHLLNKVLAPLMKPLYNMPGVAFLGVITTYLSDNPAIIALAKDKKYISYFKKNEVPCLCNLGTAFGMGLVVTMWMVSFGYTKEALIGNLGAVIGSVISVRLMAYRTKKVLGEDKVESNGVNQDEDFDAMKEEHSGDSFMERFLAASLDGGKLGVEVGMSIIPGVLIISTVIMTLTFGVKDPSIGYQGQAYEGVKLLPELGKHLSFILDPLFGFSSPEAISFPLTALGAVGSALSFVPKFLKEGLIGGNDIAVFTAMGMCWSGFLSTHVSMLDALGHRKLISKAITSHALGGIVAGVSAHYIYLLLS